MSATRIGVGGTAEPYDVVVGRGVFAELPELVGGRAAQVAGVHPEGLSELARPVLSALG
ncbi:3-dehydroquinate synthase, partial [Streptomonospora algeriensis]